MASRAPSRAVLGRLAASGLSPVTIATIFDLDLAKVRNAVATVELPEITRHDDDIRLGVQRVAWRVVEETMIMLDEASPLVKQRLVTNLFTKMMNLLSEEGGDGLEDLRGELAKIVSEVHKPFDLSEPEQPDVEVDTPNEV